jgi:hypothetical protein
MTELDKIKTKETTKINYFRLLTLKQKLELEAYPYRLLEYGDTDFTDRASVSTVRMQQLSRDTTEQLKGDTTATRNTQDNSRFVT